MAANFSRLKDWTKEKLLASDLNAEFDNILNNLGPAGIGGYSENLPQMQEDTDPFPAGVPSPADSLAGEIERIRFQLRTIMGESAPYWYSRPPVTLSDISEFTFEGGLPLSRLDFGPVSADDMIRALRPQTGANGNLIVEPGLVYYINGSEYTAAGSTVSGFAGAPTTNNTALVNSTALTGQQRTGWLGEHGTFIPVDTVGSEITLVSNRVVGFKIFNGTATEYFIGQYINDPTDGPKIYKARRANFSDYQQVTGVRITFSDNAVITLCRLVWLFIGTNGAVTASYNTPTWAISPPSSPDIGDYYFNLDTTLWYSYGPSGWLPSDSVYIGQAILDGNNVVGARTADRFRNYLDTNEVILEVNPLNVKELRQATYGARTSIYGNPFRYGFKNPTWTGTLAANTTYYAYIGDNGAQYLSTSAPHDRRGDLGGFYAVGDPIRCFGYATTDASSNFLTSTVFSFSSNRESSFYPNTISVVSKTAAYTVTADDSYIYADTTAAAFAITLPTTNIPTGKTLTIKRTNSGANTLSITGTIDGKTTVGLTSQYQAITIQWDGTAWRFLNEDFAAEVIDSGNVAIASPTTATWGDVTSITVPPGTWEFTAFHNWARNGGAFTALYTGLSLVAGNTGVNAAFGDPYNFRGAAQDAMQLTIAPVKYVATVTTTVYLKTYAVYTVTAGVASGRLFAKRISF